MTRLKTAFLWIIGVLVSGAGAAAQPATPRVVVDIPPVHALVSQVMDGVAAPQLLLSNAASPHDYAMKPSEARMLTAADLVVWTGPSLTPWLGDVLATLAPDASQIAFDGLAGVTLLPFRSGSRFDEHDEAYDDHDHGAHDDGGVDGHLWLDPRNAAVLVTGLARELSDIDPANAPLYEANASRALKDLEELEVSVNAMLAPLRGRPFVVFHDAYHYFESRFGIEASGALSVSDGVRPGARRVREIQNLMSDLNVICVFAEPQFDPKLLSALTEGTGIKAGVLDPTGSKIEPGPDHYRQTLHAMTDGLTGCLAP